MNLYFCIKTLKIFRGRNKLPSKWEQVTLNGGEYMTDYKCYCKCFLNIKFLFVK